MHLTLEETESMCDTQESSRDGSETYRVTAVAGHQPVTLDDFIGATTVTVHGPHGDQELAGAGERNGSSVQFRERQLPSAAEEMPVWEIVAVGEHCVEARSAAED